MKDFRPPFTWSFTKFNMYNECQRRYYLQYYGSIYGWKQDATEAQKTNYMLKNMTNRFILSGLKTHEVIADVIKIHSNGYEEPIKYAKKDLIKKLRESYKESIDKKWKTSIKNFCNLEEHYFEQNISDEQWVQFRENAVSNLEGFYDSEYYQNIDTIAKNIPYEIDKLDKFNYYDTQCYAAPDFAYKEDSKLIIIDWKTGKESHEHKIQLLVYALYAKNKWNIDYLDMELHAVYLKENKVVKESNINENIQTVEYLIKQNIDEIKNKLIDVDKNIANESEFKMTSNESVCKYCKFRKICHADNYKEL